MTMHALKYSQHTSTVATAEVIELCYALLPHPPIPPHPSLGPVQLTFVFKHEKIIHQAEIEF